MLLHVGQCRRADEGADECKVSSKQRWLAFEDLKDSYLVDSASYHVLRRWVLREGYCLRR